MRFMILVKATKELVAGYSLIQATSKEEAIEWTKQDFAPSESVERFREIGVGSRK
jgi:hypothetical protein